MADARLTMDEFCEIAREVVEGLPAEFLERMDRVIIDVRNRPSRRHLESLGLPPEDDSLMGLYEGASTFGAPDLLGDTLATFQPDRIWLFKRNIEAVCRSREEVAYEIRRTVIHELAHHFGWSEEDLDEFESQPNPFDDETDSFGEGG